MSVDSLSAILDVYKRHGSSFNEINVAAAWKQLGKRATGREGVGFFQQEKNVLLQLLQHTERVIPCFEARDIAGACYGMALLGFEPASATMRLLGAEVIPRVREFEPQNLNTIKWAFAKIGISDHPLFVFKAIARESEQRIGSFKPQEIAANAESAFATLGSAEIQLFVAIARESAQALRVGGFAKPQVLATTQDGAPESRTPERKAVSPRELTSLLASADSLSAVLDAYKRHGSSFDAINIATAWNRLGKARATGSERASFFRQEESALLQLLQHTEKVIPSLDARNIASACYGIARLRFEPASATMRLLGAEATPRLGEFKPQNLANTAWAFATLGISDPQLFEAIARESEHCISGFKPQEVANTAWAFATLGMPAPQLFDAIARESEQRIGSFEPQGLANTVWAFATLGVPAPQLFHAIARESEQRIGSFRPQDLINTAWAFAKAGVPAPQLFDAIARAQRVGGSAAVGGFAKPQVLANAKEGAPESRTPKRKTDSPRLITSLLTKADSLPAVLDVYKRNGSSFDEVNVVTAWSKLSKARATGRERADFFRQEEPTLLQLLQHTERIIPSLDARGISNVCYGMAKLRFEPAAGAMRLLGAEAIPSIGSFNPQALANTAWAFATLGVPASQLFDAIARESEQRVPSFNPQDLANTAWAFATLGVPAPQLFDAMARESEQRIGGFTPQGLANTAWAFAALGVPAPQLLAAIARESEQRIGGFTPQGLDNTAWAFAKAGVPAPQLFDALARESEQRIRSFKPQGLANTAWAFATLGIPAPQLFGAIARESEQRIGSFSPQDLINIAWAFATLGVPAPQLFDAIARAQRAGGSAAVGGFAKPQVLANAAEGAPESRTPERKADQLLSPRLITSLLTKADSLPTVLDVYKRDGSSFDEVNVATAWSRLSKVRVTGRERAAFFRQEESTLLQLLQHTSRTISRLDARGISTTCYSMARLRFEPAHATMRLLSAEAIQRIGEFNAQDFTNTAWAFATLGISDPQLFDAIARASEQRIGSFKPQDLTNTAWAFAMLGVPAPQLFAAIARESKQRIGSFNAQDLTNTAWAFAKAGVPAPRLFEAIARESEKRIGCFKPQEVATTAWAFATLGVPAPLFEASAHESKKRT